MSFIKAVFLGIIQGLTEFLPVSSSGHLAIFKELLGIQTPEGASAITLDILLHLGTLMAIVCAFYKDIRKMIIETIYMIRDIFLNLKTFVLNKVHNEDEPYTKIISGSYRKFVLMVIIATIPTGIIGLLIKDVVNNAASNLVIVGIALLITAVLLIIADISENLRKTPKNIPLWQAAVIGVVQGIATIPGISRSGSTLAASLFLGFDKKFAMKFSFIMSIPAILGATILDIKEVNVSAISTTTWFYYFIGMIFAFIVGYFSIRVVKYLVRERKFKYFAYYCAVAGLVAFISGIVK